MNYLNHKMTPKESQAINTLRFLCILSVVMIHSNVFKYTPQELLPSIKIIHNLFIVLPNLEILFILSGFLFFYNINVQESFLNVYRKKLKKRITGLVVPYLIWNTVGLIFDLYIKPSESLQIESFSDILLGYWPLDPMEHPFGRAIWFIRNLIFFSLISPLYFYLIKHLRHYFLLLVALVFYLDIPVDYLYVNAYLLLGSYLGFYKVSVCEWISKVDWKVYTVLFLPVLLLHSIFDSVAVLTVVYVLISLGTFMTLSLRWSHNHNISSLGMFIYVSHLYINYGITNAIINLVDRNSYTLSITMFLSWLTTITICTIAYKTLKRFCPTLLRIAIGGR